MEIIGSLILSLTQSILFYGKQIGIEKAFMYDCFKFVDIV